MATMHVQRLVVCTIGLAPANNDWSYSDGKLDIHSRDVVAKWCYQADNGGDTKEGLFKDVTLVCRRKPPSYGELQW